MVKFVKGDDRCFLIFFKSIVYKYLRIFGFDVNSDFLVMKEIIGFEQYDWKIVFDVKYKKVIEIDGFMFILRKCIIVDE